MKSTLRLLVVTALVLTVTANPLSTPAAAAADPISSTDGFYVNPNSSPAVWVRHNPDDPRAARIRTEIAAKPTARWFGNEPEGIGAAVASYVGAADSHQKLPILVAYNLPGRDACGGHSGGGAGSVGEYRVWIATFAAGIADRPAILVIEPDALGDFECMSDTAIEERLGMLRYAVEKFREKAPQTWVYLDGGNAGWVPAATMAGRLDQAGVRDARGFSVNVANYYTTAVSVNYARSVNAALGYEARFVVDTSRNGNGSNGEWCKPARAQARGDRQGRRRRRDAAVGQDARQLRRPLRHRPDRPGRPVQSRPRRPPDRRRLRDRGNPVAGLRVTREKGDRRSASPTGRTAVRAARCRAP